MGTTGHLQIVGTGSKRLAEVGMDLVARLERRWSRFLPESDVSRINRYPGRDVMVDRTTIELLAFAVAAWEGTGGTFSPFLGAAMNDIGYSRPWTAGEVLTPNAKPKFRSLRYLRNGQSDRSPLRINDHMNTVSIEPGFLVDLGGIAKGYSADLVVKELCQRGATSALVDLGGDMAFVSDPLASDPRPWQIAVENPLEIVSPIGMIVADSGGVATSSKLRRRWDSRVGESFHHLIDPTTGRPSESDIVAATVVADSCMNAEVLAKQFINMGSDGAVREAERLGVDVLIVRSDHTITRVGVWETAAA